MFLALHPLPPPPSPPSSSLSHTSHTHTSHSHARALTRVPSGAGSTCMRRVCARGSFGFARVRGHSATGICTHARVSRTCCYWDLGRAAVGMIHARVSILALLIPIVAARRVCTPWSPGAPGRPTIAFALRAWCPCAWEMAQCAFGMALWLRFAVRTWGHVISGVASCHVTSRRVASCHLRSCHVAVFCRVMSRPVLSRTSCRYAKGGHNILTQLPHSHTKHTHAARTYTAHIHSTRVRTAYTHTTHADAPVQFCLPAIASPISSAHPRLLLKLQMWGYPVLLLFIYKLKATQVEYRQTGSWIPTSLFLVALAR